MNLRAIPVTTLMILAVSAGAALAAPRDEVLEALGKCSVLTDDKARLSCYDALAPHVRDALNIPPESLSRPPTADEQKSWFGFDLAGLFGSAPAQQTTPQQFGAENTSTTHQKEAVAEQEVDSISADITDYSLTPFGKFVVFLDNGQVWKQIQGDTDKAHFLSKATDNKVTIDRGALGSYNLMLNDSAKTYKVTRVK